MVQNKLSIKYLTLYVNLKSQTKSKEDVECIITSIMGINFTLNCKVNDPLVGDLLSGVSFIDKGDILLANFGANT